MGLPNDVRRLTLKVAHEFYNFIFNVRVRAATLDSDKLRVRFHNDHEVFVTMNEFFSKLTFGVYVKNTNYNFIRS